MLPWSDLSVAEVRRACEQGQLIVRGPLNDAYRAHIRGQHVFIRHRTVRNTEYGQSFAAERHVYALLDQSVRVPKLLAVVVDEGETAYAVFEFVRTRPTDWASAHVLGRLARALATIHGTRGDTLGYVGDGRWQTDVSAHLAKIYSAEIARTEIQVRLAIGTDRLTEWVASVDALFKNEPIVLCHGDVYAKNLLTDREGNLWLIDWEAARYRVAASDFNQMRHCWLTGSQEQSVLREYVRVTGVDAARLVDQVASLRVLWHIRTMNFYVHVHKQSVREQSRHIDAARTTLRTRPTL